MKELTIPLVEGWNLMRLIMEGLNWMILIVEGSNWMFVIVEWSNWMIIIVEAFVLPTQFNPPIIHMATIWYYICIGDLFKKPSQQ